MAHQSYVRVYGRAYRDIEPSLLTPLNPLLPKHSFLLPTHLGADMAHQSGEEGMGDEEVDHALTLHGDGDPLATLFLFHSTLVHTSTTSNTTTTTPTTITTTTTITSTSTTTPTPTPTTTTPITPRHQRHPKLGPRSRCAQSGNPAPAH